jgi:hypothetical protein
MIRRIRKWLESRRQKQIASSRLEAYLNAVRREMYQREKEEFLLGDKPLEIKGKDE